ncbi:MAG: hypothetical protein OEW42_12230 [Acidimicrobiia bacterium]|nr:hypothetical protein [Acidimicrobiia bacterium]MDH5238733.1 hypothetical protein [Acidimicrobiia bacterium]
MNISRNRLLGLVVAVVVLALAATACGSDDDAGSDDSSSETTTAPAGDDGGGGEGFAVSLFEWGVDAPATAAAGSLEITATNDGAETHELVIVRADSPDDLATDDTGKVDEAGLAEGDFIGEIEEFEAETSETATFELEAGNYVLFCNIVEEEADGAFESHFLEGMVTTLTVS